MLSNLLRTGGRVDVALEMSKEMPGRLLIKVSDTGVGIRDEDKERIFERFYQIDNDVTKSNFGTGIGLHLSRLLVRLHHGNIHAENREDASGSRFIIRMPLGSGHLRADEMVEGCIFCRLPPKCRTLKKSIWTMLTRSKPGKPKTRQKGVGGRR